jgi:hypothetical protein
MVPTRRLPWNTFDSQTTPLSRHQNHLNNLRPQLFSNLYNIRSHDTQILVPRRFKVLTNLVAVVAVPFRTKVKVVCARISAANPCSCCRIVSGSFLLSGWLVSCQYGSDIKSAIYFLSSLRDESVNIPLDESIKEMVSLSCGSPKFNSYLHVYHLYNFPVAVVFPPTIGMSGAPTNARFSIPATP